jgi:hypothetical protein
MTTVRAGSEAVKERFFFGATNFAYNLNCLQDYRTPLAAARLGGPCSDPSQCPGSVYERCLRRSREILPIGCDGLLKRLELLAKRLLAPVCRTTWIFLLGHHTMLGERTMHRRHLRWSGRILRDGLKGLCQGSELS